MKKGEMIVKINPIELRSLYQTKTAAQIGIEIGCNPKTILSRLHAFGIPTRPARRMDMAREKNPRWTGSAATYGAFHQRTLRIRGRPSHCEVCGKSNPRKRYEWANITGDLNDPYQFKRMCVPCHRAHDGNLPWQNKLRSKKSAVVPIAPEKAGAA